MKTEFEQTFEIIGGFIGEIVDGKEGKKKGETIGAFVGKAIEEIIRATGESNKRPIRKQISRKKSERTYKELSGNETEPVHIF